ncbi:hypothetical protein DNTS_004594 [Danionella cerebrum]|uniref:SH2 domain-containing protein n=1 Tax=Danionella cerebrum TaxID=2873325 RepID=A0A553PZ59_9TELE|nr:hypothetical protein DNTS_004594 [Danionella translucida]
MREHIAVMAEGSEFDLIYITENIIGVSFHQSCTDQSLDQNVRRITQMLQGKHADRYMVINLSERSDEVNRMTHRVLDLGWPEFHAPSLHLLCSLCKTMENWLSAHQENVLLLHCRGSKDRLGVVISSYMHLFSLSSSEEHALDLYSMKRFCCDQMLNLMTPSQKRYVQVFGRLLTHQIHLNSSPLFIQHVKLHGIPLFNPTVHQLFIRVYQGTHAVYTSGLHQVAVDQAEIVCFVLDPPQMLKGDIMIVCYNNNLSMRTHETVFHPSFPQDAVVEVLFSHIAEGEPFLSSDCERWRSRPTVLTENEPQGSPQAQWDTADSLLRAAKSKESACSVSSDSGLSSSSQWTGGQASVFPERYSSEENAQLHRETPGRRMEEEQPSLSILSFHPTSTQSPLDHSGHLNCQAMFIERETDIIDDDDGEDITSRKDTNPVSTLATKKTSGLSLGWNYIHTNFSQTDTDPAQVRDDLNSSNSLMDSSVPAGYQTHIWVKQQQSTSSTHNPSDRLKAPPGIRHGTSSETSSSENGFQVAQPEPEKEDEFATLALDIDHSIEQLNQLILDLDPDFEPIPTQARSHMTRSASLHTNGKTYPSNKAKQHLSGWRQKQLSEVSEYSVLRSPNADQTKNIQRFNFGTPSLRGLYHSDTVDFADLPQEVDSSLWTGSNQVPPTPAFPVSPPTPYVKSGHEVISQRTGSRNYMGTPVWEESRGYTDNMTHTSVSSDGELFHSDVTGSPSSCQRMFGSLHSISSSSPLVNTDSSTPAHSWLEGGSSTPLSHYTPQPSPPLSLSAPNSQSSPRGAPRSLSAALEEASLESSLLEAVEGLEALGLDAVQPPLLPLKRRGTDASETLMSFPLSRSMTSMSYASHSSSPTRSTPSPDFMMAAIAVLKDKEPGSFIIRDSHSFRGAYGLAMKVATPPPSILQQSRKAGDLSSELVRHFLIECTPKGVRLKGCPNEPYFGSLTALVCQHSITPLALPCRLIIPSRDPLEELNESSQSQTSTNSAAELLKQGAACNVWFLGSVNLESLTGVQGVQKATTVVFSMDPPPTSTVVHFKVSAQGITLTDNQRKRHYTVNTVIFCALDPQERKIFGFIARKSSTSTENVCHLFAEHDPEQPASAIVNFVSKVMIGSQKTK